LLLDKTLPQPTNPTMMETSRDGTESGYAETRYGRMLLDCEKYGTQGNITVSDVLLTKKG